jgi:hypothetical protein
VMAGSDAIVMEGGAGGDEDGVGAERASVGLGHGCGDLRPRARHRIAQRGALAGAAALPLHRRLLGPQRRHRVDLHPARHVLSHGLRSPHARPSHQQVCGASLVPLPHLSAYLTCLVAEPLVDAPMCRILPSRQQQPEMYKMYLDLTSTYVFSLASTKIMPCRDR